MNLLETLLSPDNAAVVQSIAKSLDLDETGTRDAIGQMIPEVTRAMGGNAGPSGEGLGSLLEALQSGNHGRYLENPELLGEPDSIADGNNILGHVLGSKDVSREVATRASEGTGISSDVLKQMLPMLAAAAMGVLGQKTAGSGAAAQGGPPPTTALLGLAGFLDSDGDGSITDDLLEMATKSFLK